MYTIAKKFHFSASHQLITLPDGHPCSRLHGHNYVVEVELQSNELDGHGFVLDFGELKPVKTFIDGVLDHRHLNDVMETDTPTAEYIAAYIFTICLTKLNLPVSAVTVWETEKCWARYEANQREHYASSR